MPLNTSNRIKGSLILLLTALIFGTSFAAQKMGMDYMEPFAFNGTRIMMGAIFMTFITVINSKFNKINKADSNDKDKRSRKDLIIAGLLCGSFLFLANNLQQVGIQYTTAGKAGFITALYIVLVPILGFFIGKRIRKIVIISLLIAVFGLYMLCMTERLTIGKGDILEILCAFFFAVHILITDHYVSKVDPLKLSCFQLYVASILSFIASFLFETTDFRAIYLALPALLFTGVGSSGIAHTLQIYGQKLCEPTVASLVMSFESVFSVLGGAIILHDVMTQREIIGCVLMFIAVISSQISPESILKKSSGGE